MNGTINYIKQAPTKAIGIFITSLWGIYDLIITRPLRFLYFTGFWVGTDDCDMCTQLSPGTMSPFWAAHPEACEELIDRNFRSFDAKVTCFVYFAILFFIVMLIFMNCMCRCFFIRPIVEKLREGMKQDKKNHCSPVNAKKRSPKTSSPCNNRSASVSASGSANRSSITRSHSFPDKINL